MAVFRVGDRIYGSAKGKCLFRRRKAKVKDVADIDRVVEKIRLQVKQNDVDMRRISRRLRDAERSSSQGNARQTEDGLFSLMEKLRNEKTELEKEAVEWLSYREEIQDRANYPQRRFRKKYRKITEEKAETAVARYIKGQKALGESRVTAEEISSACGIPKGQACVVLHRLNLAGVVSQKRRCFAHDTNRNPVFDGGVSGWGANVYDLI